ncbi:MAG: glucosamine-6-phosphate isomerase, partial [Bacteroidales bacterium]|nr:glucosamine-6-phosphate isomerase [Bacteroidales bacterium]
MKGFGLDINRALLMNSDTIPLPNNKHFTEVFPDLNVDLSLRYRSCKTKLEYLQRDAIFMIDNWCSNFEAQIREKGGIGYFLGGIGPDGHIAFNMRGTDEFSTTRLTSTNFETQAVAASDLGGIEVSRDRKIITIGLNTITYNPDAVAIIMAAGEAKAQIVKESLESEQTNVYPASVLRKLPRSRFYLTAGAAYKLNDLVDKYFFDSEWNIKKSEKAVIDLCKKINKYGYKLDLEDLQNDKFCKEIPNLSLKTIDTVTERINSKIERGLKLEKNQVFLHTGPHHDDIMLGIFPYIAKQINEPSNQFYFSVLTSGFNAVTNKFVIDLLQDTKDLILQGKIQMLYYADFFQHGYKFKRDKDVFHYIRSLVAKDLAEVRRATCHRLVRSIIEIYNTQNEEEILSTIDDLILLLKNSFDGEKNPPNIQKLKGMIREFEEDLVWAHLGISGDKVEHLRLGFYKGDIFTEQPEINRDV